MSVSDEELQQLESYLDKELPTAEAEELGERVSIDAQLSGALEALRGQRDGRVAAFRSMEPTDAEVARFTAGFDRALREQRKQERWGKIAAQLRPLTAAAACLVVGFTVGWFGRDRTSDAGPTGPASAGYVTRYESGAAGLAEVTLTNERGEIIAVQPFQSPEQAQQFAQDLEQVRRRQEQLREAQQVYTKHQQF